MSGFVALGWWDTTAQPGLVELERELDALLLEYESLSGARPKEPRILTRAKIGQR